MRRRLIIAAMAAVGLLIVAAVAVPVFSVLQPGYYERYPVLAKRMEHWTTSTHSKVGCAECHVEPGTRGAVEFAVRAVPAFYSQLAQGPAEFNLLKAPGRAACQSCHTTYRKVGPSGDLLIPHRAHVEVLKMECSTCHRNLVHSLNRHGFNRPEMESCLTCHDGDTASDECTDCHTRKQVPPSHTEKTWLQEHGDAAKFEDCESCHSWTPEYCAECHSKKPASHVGNWKEGHAEPAKVRGDGCLVCHGGQKFCDRCH